MRVFISWSGSTSKQLAETLRGWLPSTLQFVRPFFTPDDVEKGSRWAPEISKELEQAAVGVLVLTKDNLTAPWLLFEAGALSRAIDKSRVCPLRFGVENTDLEGPLAQFQSAGFSKVDILKLVETINANAPPESKLTSDILKNVFEMWWPRLEADVKRILESSKGGPVTHDAIRSDRDLIEEVLSLTRLLAAERPHQEPSRHASKFLRHEIHRIAEAMVDVILQSPIPIAPSLMEACDRVVNLAELNGWGRLDSVIRLRRAMGSPWASSPKPEDLSLKPRIPNSTAS